MNLVNFPVCHAGSEQRKTLFDHVPDLRVTNCQGVQNIKEIGINLEVCEVALTGQSLNCHNKTKSKEYVERNLAL